MLGVGRLASISNAMAFPTQCLVFAWLAQAKRERQVTRARQPLEYSNGKFHSRRSLALLKKEMSFRTKSDQFHPGQLFLRKNIFRRRERFRMVEARGCDIDFVRTIGMLISKRGPAAIAKCPPGACLRAISGWRSLIDIETGTPYRNPGHRLRSNGAPAVFAMAIGLVQNFRGGAKTHVSAITAAIYRSAVHRTESTAAAGDARLRITPEVSARL